LNIQDQNNKASFDKLRMPYFVKIAIPLILASITIMLPHGIFTQKVQIADIVFLIVLIPIVVKFISEKRHIYWSPFIKPIIAYAAVAFLSIFVSVSIKTTIVEFIGFSYLVVLFLLWVNIVDTRELLNYAVRWWIAISVVVSVLGFLSILLAYGFDIKTPFIKLFEKHPYIDNLYRVHSTFSQNEKFFSSYLLISIPLALSLAFYEKKQSVKFLLFGTVILFLINVFFTYSRSIIGILIAIYIVVFGSHIIISSLRNKWFTKILKGLSIAFIAVVWILILLVSHIQFIDASSETDTLFDLPDKMKAPFYYRSDIGIKQTEVNVWYNYTYYLLLKQYALKMFAEHPFTGVGNGAFIDQMRIYDRDGRAPKGYLLFDPHSMFFGSLAELGVFGFSALIYLWLSIILTLRKKLKNFDKLNSVDGYSFYLMLALYAATIGFFIQGTDMDIMNFRFLWLLFGFNAIILRLPEKIGG